MEDLDKLNPQIKKVKVGKKTLTQIDILPLSWTDQSVVLDKFFEVFLAGASSFANLKDVDVLIEVKKLITTNIELILQYVVDSEEIKPSEIMKVITNSQLLEIIEIIWEVNYADPLEKRGMDLLTRIQKAFRMNISSPPSPSDTVSQSEPSAPLLRRVD
jgi:hypothetical protein